ncbi:blue-light-activated protein [mine drainage metagenome]|uniref:Blue-light-activated protein n=1 Tax=mine drainage metagenome TaxID=410659 RepID=A0A1J5SYC8_9ZZZZ
MTGTKQRPTPQVVACVVYVLLHLAADASATFFQVAPGISLWYPPAGLALSLLLLLGIRYAPIVFAANVASALLTSGFHVWWAPFLFPLLITLNYSGAAWLMTRYGSGGLMPDSRDRAFTFASIILGAPALLAFVGTGVLIPLGYASASDLIHSSLRWWIGDVSGLLTVVPLALVFAGPLINPEARARRVPWLRTLREVSLFGVEMLVLLACLGLVFEFGPLRNYNAFYLCFLPLIWICIRHGLPGATIATLLVTMGGMIGMHITGSTTYLIINFLLFQLAVAVVGLGLGTAVTRRSEAERELAASESRFERVIDGAQLGLWDWNIARNRVSFNARWSAITGLPASGPTSDFAGWASLVHPMDRDRFSAALHEHLEGRSALIEVAYRIRTRDNHVRWMIARGSTVARDANGRPLLVSGTHTDITETRLAEAETHRLLNIIEANTDFIATADTAGELLYANASLRSLLAQLGARTTADRRLSELFAPRSARILQAEAMPAAAESGFWHGELILVGAAGKDLPVSIVLLPHREAESDGVTFSLIMRDISRQRQAEAERIEGERKMLQVQKLESIGVLAGGIAHDFNNLLTAIMGNASLARLDLPENIQANAALTQIEGAAERAAELCQQMLAYAGRSPLAFSTVNLSDLIDQTTQLLQISLHKNTTLDLRLQRPVASVKADATQLRQIIMNLVINASEAIGERVGRILVRTESRYFDQPELRANFEDQDVPAGDYVLVEVEDNGSGMPAEIRQHIFEPFFTTKFTGRGLGLAAVLGIVKAHRGAIQVSSESGQGTVFRVIIPAYGANASTPPATASRPAAAMRQGLVLVVDDEESVRAVVARTLESLGFRPIVASDGVEGVECVTRDLKALSFVLLDLVMPRMDGHDAFTAIRRIAPDLPVILMSGFSEKLSLERFADAKPTAFISKPFARDALTRCLERAGLPKAS